MRPIAVMGRPCGRRSTSPCATTTMCWYHRLRWPAPAATDSADLETAEEADIVSGSRYLRRFPGDSHPPAERRQINEIITAEVNRRLGLKLTDAFCGFKAYRVPVLARSVDRRRLRHAVGVVGAGGAAGVEIVEVAVPLIYLDESRSFGGVDGPARNPAGRLSPRDGRMDQGPGIRDQGPGARGQGPARSDYSKLSAIYVPRFPSTAIPPLSRARGERSRRGGTAVFRGWQTGRSECPTSCPS